MRKFLFLLLEIFIGILLLSILIVPGIYKFREYVNNYPCYTVKFKDVDGLNVGSPVRLMGIQVGHVIRLELLESEIYITFRITEKKTPIPDGSYASVQFTGLAGSKSLEIKPPDIVVADSKKIIYSVEPVRINSVLQVQTTISENILEFCQGMLGFFKKDKIESTKTNIENTSRYVQETNKSVINALNTIKSSGSSIIKDTKELKQFVDDQNKNINKAYDSFKAISKDKNLTHNMDKFQTTVENLSSSANINQIDKKVNELTKKIDTVNDKVVTFNKEVNKIKNNETKYVTEINNSLKSAASNMNGFIEIAKKKSETKEKDAIKD